MSSKYYFHENNEPPPEYTDNPLLVRDGVALREIVKLGDRGYAQASSNKAQWQEALKQLKASIVTEFENSRRAKNYDVPPVLYYPVQEVADEVGCSVDYLLRLAGAAEILIGICRTAQITPRVRSATDHELFDWKTDAVFFGTVVLHLHPHWFAEIRGDHGCCFSATKFIEPWHKKWLDEGWEYQAIYWQSSITLEFTANDLVVTHQQLEKIRKSWATANRVAPTDSIKPKHKKQHGNTLRNQERREKILNVADLCMEQFPLQCEKNGEVNFNKWADCVCEKWRLYHPDELDPPIQHGTIRDHLRSRAKSQK